MCPKDTAIEKLFYVLFRLDAALPQPLAYYWQCLASLTNLYSQVLPGMRPFVAPLIRMTHKEHNNRPWRLCAALYHPTSNELLSWSTYRLPYARDIRAQFQVQREYLGHLLATILVARNGHQSERNNHLSYEWINDNTGALKWAENHKCD